MINQQNWTVMDQGKVDRAFRTAEGKRNWEKITSFKQYVSPEKDVYRFVDFYLS